MTEAKEEEELSIGYHRRLSFIADWYQEEASVTRTFNLSFYFVDNAVQVYDVKTKKLFLRRTMMPDLVERDFFIGSKVTIFGRQFDIVDYADDLTRATIATHRAKTFLLLKYMVFHYLPDILCAFVDSNYTINKALMVRLTEDQVREYLGKKNRGDMNSAVLIRQLMWGPVVAFELIGEDIINTLKNCQAQNYEYFKDDDRILPTAMMELFKNEDFRNGIYCAENENHVNKYTEFFFGPQNGLHDGHTCVMKNTTLCIIKPHCIKDGYLGKIIKDIIRHGFRVTAFRTHLLERVNCEEFFEVYRGLLPDYIGLVQHLNSGTCVAMELQHVDPTKHTQEEFRKLCGPANPDLARLLRPKCLRATYGINRAMNALHCTDLPEDTVLELQYLFVIVH